MEGGEPQIAVTVPLFLKKLWKMVNDKDAEHIIGWNSTGDGFVIYDQLQFIMKLLPQYFKHNNMASFIRQLNFYDFHKVAGIDKDEMHFTHNCFLKNLPETLVFIRRKCTTVKSKIANSVKEEELSDLLNGVKEIKSKHFMVDSELKLLKQENAALWSEMNSLRVKHSKQTKIINKIIHFLISYMHSHQTSFSKRGGAVNRKNNQNNLKTGPTILEIDYHNSADSPKQTKQNYTVTEPGQSDAFTDENTQDSSTTQPALESFLDEILNAVPTVKQQKMLSSTNSVHNGSLGKLKPVTALKNSRANLSDNNSETATPDILRNAVLNIFENPKENFRADKLDHLKTGMVENLIFNMPVDSKVGSSDDVFDSTIASTGGSSTNMLTNLKNSLESTSNIQKTPVPFKNPLSYSILENPKENLESYLDNTHTELSNLQDMLNNLSSTELCDFLNLIEGGEPYNQKESITGTDSENFNEVMQDATIDNIVGDTSKDINNALYNNYIVLPLESDDQDVTATLGIKSENEKLITENSMPSAIQVDEYFSPDFQI